MQDIGIISEKINSLYRIADKEFILLEEVNPVFLHDLQDFVVGHTLTIYKGKLSVGHNLYRRWLRKLQTKGFDYAINFSE